MVESRGGLCLGQKAIAIALRCEGSAEDHLHRQLPVQVHLTRQVDDAHPAPADLLEQLIISNVAR